jgi:hypothetical protein
MSQQQQEHRLGELLIDMGFLQQKELEDAVSMAQQTRLPLGSVLVMSGHLSDKELRAVVLGQSLLKDNVIVKDDMFKVMQIVRERGVSFEEGMQMLEGSVDINTKETNKLGELLIESERITKDQLQTALDTVESSGLPLGRVLVLTNAVTENVLKVGLEVQIGVRDGSVSREEAIAKLRNATSQSSVTRQSIEMTAPTLDKILRLGEFFEKAGIISDTDMLNALEVALSQQRRVGEVLVQFNLVSERMVEAALELQHLTRGRQIRPDQAISALQNMHFNGMTLHQALGVPEPEAAFIRPETLYMPLPNNQASLLSSAPPAPQAVPPPAPPPAPPAAPAPAPAPAPAAADPNAVLLSGWGDENPAEEVREGWGEPAEAAPVQTGWGDQQEPAPAPAPQAVPAPPQAEPAQMAAPPTFAQPDQAAAAAQPMQQFVTASGEFTSVPMAAQPQAYDPAQGAQPGFPASGALAPPAPTGYSPLPTQPVAPAASTPAQTQVDIPAQQPPAPPPAPAPAPAQTQVDIPAQQPPVAPAPAAPSPAQTQIDIPAQAPPPAPEPAQAQAADQPAVAEAAPAPASAAPPSQPAPASITGRQDAVDGVIAEIAFEAAQFAAAQETAAVSAGGLGIEAVGLAQLLKVTGIVTQAEMDRAIKDVIRDSVLLHDILKSSGVGDPMTLRAAYDAHIMVIGGQLTFEHAMIALDYCKRQKLSLYEAFKQLGWLQE